MLPKLFSKEGALGLSSDLPSRDTVWCCLCRYAAQRGTHAEVLARFERDMAALAATELPRAAQGPGLRRASEILPEAQLREWAAQCQAAHGALNDKVRPGCLHGM